MKTINWNQASELGLIARINNEILHPLGLAMCRDVESGASPHIYVAPDGAFEYDEKLKIDTFTDEEVKQKLLEMLGGDLGA